MEPGVDVAETKAPYRHWRSLSDGLMYSLIIVGPTFLFAELWRGKPIIDQPGFLWVIPACIMTVGIFTGGRVAGRHRSRREGAFNQGVLVAILTIILIFVADLIRRLVLTQTVPVAVLGLWLVAAAAAILVGGVGGLSGRRSSLRAQKRSQMDRFL
jgi:hypothetical protein